MNALLRITTAFLKHPRLFHAHFCILSEKLPQGKYHTKFHYRILETPTLVSRLFPYLIRQIVTRKINIKPNSITAFLKHPRLFHAHFLSGKLSHRLPVIPRKYRHHIIATPRGLTKWILQNCSLFTKLQNVSQNVNIASCAKTQWQKTQNYQNDSWNKNACRSKGK